MSPISVLKVCDTTNNGDNSGNTGKSMSLAERRHISENAMATVKRLTDEKVDREHIRPVHLTV